MKKLLLLSFIILALASCATYNNTSDNIADSSFKADLIDAIVVDFYAGDTANKKIYIPEFLLD